MSILERPYGLASLTESLQGSVVFPDHPSWDAAREAYNLAVDQQPEAIAFPADARDVQEIVRYAAAKGFRVAPQRTGHNASPIESLDGVILLKTDRLDEVTIDRDALRARVGAGVKWEKVVPRASELGLAALHGSTPDVSIAGYGLGGGLGGTAASTASSRTASPRSSSSPRTASSAGSTPTTSPSCSGRSAAAAATSAS